MSHAAPFAVHWQITRTRSWELQWQRECKSISERKWGGNIIYGKFTDWFLIAVLYSFFFLSALKETAPIARMTHSSDVASDVGLPVSYYVNLLSQRGASARFQIRPQMWRQRRETAWGGKPIIRGQTWVLRVCSSLAARADLKEHWEVCSL